MFALIVLLLLAQKSLIKWISFAEHFYSTFTTWKQISWRRWFGDKDAGEGFACSLNCRLIKFTINYRTIGWPRLHIWTFCYCSMTNIFPENFIKWKFSKSSNDFMRIIVTETHGSNEKDVHGERRKTTKQILRRGIEWHIIFVLTK